MKASIKIEQHNESIHYWTLIVESNKRVYAFSLGQDIKFCKRVLRIEPQALVTMLGTNNLLEGTDGNKRLANVICAVMDITPSRIRHIPKQSFCAN